MTDMPDHGSDARTTRIARPLFLVGAERSGTTLLRLMLDHHPELAVHFEFEFAVDRLPPGGGWPPLEEYWRYLDTHRIFQHAGWTIDRSLSYPQLVNSFLLQKRDRDGKKLVGATVHHHFDRLRRVWPDGRYIHLLRDGRDVARSVMRLGWAGNIWHAADRWIEAENTWERLRGELPTADWIEVRYEDLIRDAPGTLRRLCAFIGVGYDSAMFDYAEHSTYELPDPALITQWRTKLTEAEIRLVEAKIGPMLVDRGYEISGLEPARPSACRRAWLRFHSRLGRALFRARRYGPSLFVQELLARRLRLSGWQRRVRRALNAVEARQLK